MMTGIPATQATAADSGRDGRGRPVHLSGWGRNPVFAASEAWPATSEDLSDCLAGPYLPRGLGRSYGDAGLPAEGHLAVNSGALDRFLSFDPETGILEAEAGVTLDRILKVFVPKGWFLPVTPGTALVSLGGALASNVHGKNHHRCGSIENFLDNVEVMTPQGTFTCSPTLRPEIFRATVGGYGLTGFITRARLRLKPIRSSRVVCLRERARGLDALFRLFEKRDADWEYSVAWLDTLAKGRSLGRGVLMLGNHEEPAHGAPSPTRGHSASGKSAAGKSALGGPGPGPALKVPAPMPGSLLNPGLLSLFNFAFFRFSRGGGPSPESFAAFFYPLDRIGDWNLLYGPKGFYQYQFVLPDPAEDGVAACLEFLSRSRLGAFLSVLKRCGDDHALLPFCRKGYTLALDIPARGEETLRLLRDLDALVIGHRGRVYLTKDARLPKEAFRAMYPEWRDFMAEVRRLDPAGASRSRLAERLGLWEA